MDCLVSRLKEVVDNPNLPYFREIVVNCKSNTNIKVYSRNKGAKLMMLTEGATFSNGQTTMNVAAGSKVTPSSASDYRMRILGEDNLLIDYLEMEYCDCTSDSLMELSSVMTHLYLRSTGTDNIVNFAEFPRMEFLKLNRSTISGTLESYVATHCTKYPTSTLKVYVGLYLTNATFHNASIGDTYVKFSENGTAKVYSDDALTSLLATYNGSTWVYA